MKKFHRHFDSIDSTIEFFKNNYTSNLKSLGEFVVHPSHTYPDGSVLSERLLFSYSVNSKSGDEAFQTGEFRLNESKVMFCNGLPEYVNGDHQFAVVYDCLTDKRNWFDEKTNTWTRN